MAPKVSVCIPAYQQTVLLRKTLESLLSQTFTDYELIITDDTPGDEVEQLVRSFDFGAKLQYARNVSQLGSPGNWNEALSRARGQYIKIMHHDDWFLNEKSLGKFVSLLDQQPGADLAFCATQILDTRDQSLSLNRPDAVQIDAIRHNPASLLYHNNIIGAPSAVIYRNKSGLRFDERIKYVVDIDFYIQILLQNRKLLYYSEPLIVNTSHSPLQVTQASLDKSTQVGEYTYLYNKVKKGSWPDMRDLLFFRQLFLQYNIQSLHEYKSMGFDPPEPRIVFSLLIRYLKFTRKYTHA
jgi:glycosyltransferase involved in cell wall biosynthesis